MAVAGVEARYSAEAPMRRILEFGGNMRSEDWVKERNRLQEVIDRLYDERAPLLRMPQPLPNQSQGASPTASRAEQLADVERRINFAQLELLAHLARKPPGP